MIIIYFIAHKAQQIVFKIKAIHLCSEDFSSEVLTFLQSLGKNRRGTSSKKHEHLAFLEGTLENISVILIACIPKSKRDKESLCRKMLK